MPEAAAANTDNRIQASGDTALVPPANDSFSANFLPTDDSSLRPASVADDNEDASDAASQLATSNKPLDTPFRQQRLPAWRPLLTPQNVIPILFCIGLVFVPLGIVFLVSSTGVQEYAFDYTDCLSKAPVGVFGSVPASSNGGGSSSAKNFQWRRVSDASQVCEIQFAIDKEISGPVFMYYKLSNYYQNNRLYVKSVSYNQLKGEALDRAALKEACDPLVGPANSNKVYYPCGLIANSYFSDVYSPLKNIATKEAIVFAPKNITWNADKNIYKPTSYSLDQIAPPPFWVKRSEYVDDDGNYKKIPPIWNDERFQVWMRIAAFPTFRKLYGKYNGDIQPGTYSFTIDSQYDVKAYNGTKSVMISTVSWIGGKNTFLGVAYLIVGGVCLLIGCFFLIKNIVSPRALGDFNYLSWNRQ